MTEIPFVIFIMGPTATGKTDLAIYLHKKINSEIISVDSAMVYRGLDIGTAKPDRELLEKVPHRLIDICDPVETYSAARFQQDAYLAINEIYDKGKIPILVGGTGLYFRALEYGLDKLPEANYLVRAKIEEEAETEGWKYMHSKLGKIDAKSATRINQNDTQRIQRALEVFEITGRTLSELTEKSKKKSFPFTIKKIILFPNDRSQLRERIKQRFHEMLKNGLVEEVESFFHRDDLSSKLPSMRLVGYRQIWRYLDNQITYKEMQEHSIIATQQLAKRQLTWCRAEKGAECYDSYKSEIFPQILDNLK